MTLMSFWSVEVVVAIVAVVTALEYFGSATNVEYYAISVSFAVLIGAIMQGMIYGLTKLFGGVVFRPGLTLIIQVTFLAYCVACGLRDRRLSQHR